MAFEFEQSESVENGGDFLEAAGTYHMLVTAIDIEPKKEDGTILDAIKVTCRVLAGTTKDQEGRTFNLMLFKPTLKSKNNGEFARKVITRFFMAVGCLHNHQSGQRVTIDENQAIGRQFVCKLILEENDKKPGTFRLRLSFADIWHVDDPDCERVPKDPQMIALIEKTLRKNPGDFPSARKSSPAPVVAAAASAAAAPAVSLDDF